MRGEISRNHSHNQRLQHNQKSTDTPSAVAFAVAVDTYVPQPTPVLNATEAAIRTYLVVLVVTYVTAPRFVILLQMLLAVGFSFVL